MDFPVRKQLPHAVPQWVSDGGFFFITMNCALRGENQLCRAGVGDVVLRAFAQYHDLMNWHCRVALLMPDHVHAILAFPANSTMKATVSAWKRFVGRTCGIQWQRDFFDHRLREVHEADKKLSYILMNPVRRGLCERMGDWPWVYRPNTRLPPSW